MTTDTHDAPKISPGAEVSGVKPFLTLQLMHGFHHHVNE